MNDVNGDGVLRRRGVALAVSPRGEWPLPEDDHTVVHVLGRFAVIRGGVELPIPLGLPQKLVKFLATRDRGRAHTEQAIEALWPDISAGDGRKRLRNVLNRVRESAGELIVREGEETLSFGKGVEIDAMVFEQDARRARDELNDDHEAMSTARSVVDKYDELLPDDLYELWLTQPRERIKERCLGLLELLATAARASGDFKVECAALERAMEIDPDDISRYLVSAESLYAQGKTLQAYAMLARAKRAARAAGLPEPPDLPLAS
jgi:DNA-binding SARP family transcriptional activator